MKNLLLIPAGSFAYLVALTVCGMCFGFLPGSSIFPYIFGLLLFWAAAFALTVFTIAISAALIMLDIMSVFLSGLVWAAAMKTAAGRRLGAFEALIHGALGFILCADIVSAVIVLVKTKRPE